MRSFTGIDPKYRRLFTLILYLVYKVAPSFLKTLKFFCAALAIITLLAPHSSLNLNTSAKSFMTADPPFAIIGIFTLSTTFLIASEIDKFCDLFDNNSNRATAIDSN